jgi:DNA polymerase-3 subunit alpha
MESAQNEPKKNIEGQISLFQMDGIGGQDSGSLIDVGGQLPSVKPFSKEVSMSMEKEMLGVYLSDHPLKDYVGQMRKLSSITCEDILRAEEDMAQGAVNTAIRDNMSCTICGIVTTRKTQITKNGAMMAFIVIEDLYGSAEIVVFPKVYERVSQLTEIDRVIRIRGTLNFKEDEAPKILANDITELESDEKAGITADPEAPKAAADPVKPETKAPSEKPECMIKIRIPRDMDDRITMDMINTALKRHAGDKLTAVLMYMPSGRTLKSVMRLEPSGSLKNQLIGLLGMDNVKF